MTPVENAESRQTGTSVSTTCQVKIQTLSNRAFPLVDAHTNMHIQLHKCTHTNKYTQIQ